MRKCSQRSQRRRQKPLLAGRESPTPRVGGKGPPDMTRRKPRPTERRPADDAERSAREACELLGLGNDPVRLCPADRLRVDMVSTLRLVIDHAGEAVLAGGAADLTRLVGAVDHLT